MCPSPPTSLPWWWVHLRASESHSLHVHVYTSPVYMQEHRSSQSCMVWEGVIGKGSLGVWRGIAQKLLCTERTAFGLTGFMLSFSALQLLYSFLHMRNIHVYWCVCIFDAYDMQTEKMLSAAEEVVGEYLWGQYDILVLPPSFPYGGMENPCLTFLSPSLLVSWCLLCIILYTCIYKILTAAWMQIVAMGWIMLWLNNTLIVVTPIGSFTLFCVP